MSKPSWRRPARLRISLTNILKPKQDHEHTEQTLTPTLGCDDHPPNSFYGTATIATPSLLTKDLSPKPL
ncbi:MAG: hypothetical protein EKK48_24145 [Candidatus Melainabacteria bacterium]|nr:MAG: hypothetical protein EKK48_24145 [Candidatus Melainabacteria bacterium]